MIFSFLEHYHFGSAILLARFENHCFPLTWPISPMAQAIVVGGGLAGVSAANTVLECGDLAAAALMIGSAMTNLPVYRCFFGEYDYL